MNAKEIAEKIKDKVNLHEASQIPADEQLLLKMSVAVCEELGMEPTALHISHVAQLIREEGLDVKDEYPKTLYHPEYDPTSPKLFHVITLNSAEDEEDYADWRSTPYPEEKPRKKSKKDDD